MRTVTSTCTVAIATAALLIAAGCQSSQPRRARAGSPRVSRTAARESSPVKRVVCLFDQRPWLSLDASGDRDPEGIHFRVYLVDGGGKGIQRDGTLRIEMYEIGHDENGRQTRTLTSDWKYSTADFPCVQSRILGYGYHPRLRWADKSTAGKEIEIITHFDDGVNESIRSGTRRFRVPNYSK